MEKEETKNSVKEFDIETLVIEEGKLFLPKAICLLSRYPFFEQFKKILIDLKNYIDKEIKAPFEDYLTHLIYSIPAPPRGLAKIVLRLLDK